MPSISGQLNEAERALLTSAVLQAPKKPQVVIEVGTWLGGGSTLHILRALHQNGIGHLWGIEADRSTYEQMLENIRTAAPEASGRFTPLFGLSQRVIPKWIADQGAGLVVDLAFLDGGNNPMEQITEFRLLDPLIPVGGQLMAHDARLRKGKWLGPYISRLDNWQTKVHEVSEEGLLHATKIGTHPSAASLKSASSQLFKMRLQPAEIAAAIFPSKVCGLILRMLPAKLSRSLSDGRN